MSDNDRFSPLPDERLDQINDGIRLLQKKQGLTFGTDAYLLASYMRPMPRARAVDLGGGSGVLPLLLLYRNKVRSALAVELQPAFADLIRRNAAGNGKENELSVIEGDVRDITAADLSGEVDLVLSNPPYLPLHSGKGNRAPEKGIACHEVAGTIFDFCAAAGRILKYGGLFYTVFRPERMADLFSALRENGMEPKRMTLVYPDAASEPCALLTEAKRGASPSLKCTPPLFLYTEESKGRRVRELTPDAAYIYETGEFPSPFRIK